MVLLKHLTKLIRNTKRVGHHHTGPKPDHFHMRNFTQAREDIFQATITQGKRVPAGNEDIPNRRRLADVVENPVNSRRRDRPLLRTNQAPARAMSAIHRTHFGDYKKYTVRVTMGQK